MKKEEQEREKIHNSNFIDACHNAINGIIYATTTQSNIKKQLVIAATIMILSLFFDLSRAEFLCLVFAVVLVIFAEMINTAIETVVDLYTDRYHPKAKIAKDVGAGAVVLTAINAVILAYFLFFDKIGIIGTSILESVISSPVHIAFVAIVLTVIAVVAWQAAASTNKHKLINQKFMPSGHSAIAFAALTAIWLNTKDIVIFTLSLVLSLLVAESRVDGNKRTASEVFFGACMGVLIVILAYGLTFFEGNI
jgi:diacylglycerol kinase